MVTDIVLQNVSKKYKNGDRVTHAVDNINLQVNKGEFCTILGSSGCGKSTIINLIAGFIEPSEGEIFVNNKQVFLPGPDRVVVSQDYSLFSWKSVRANVEFGLKAQGLPKAERNQRAEYYLKLVHLFEFADNYPIELSGGMRQRLALIRAMVVEPACLLLDEPLAALDMLMRHKFQDELLNIWEKTGKTVLLVTHDLEEALYLSERIVIMGKQPGKIFEEIEIPFSKPRLPELRLTDEFQAWKRKMSCLMNKIG